jgi:hypothetical protein
MTLRRLLREEDGQALFWGAGVIVIIVVLFFGAVDIGQLVLGKIQSQNAADGAALSAASLKASVHNTRVLAYRAASGQLTLSRLELMRASAADVAEIVKPGGANQKLYKESFRQARGHRFKLEKLRSGLIAFNTWATKQPNGAQMVRQAAEVGYQGNIGSLGMADPGNLSLMSRDESIAENDRSFGNKIIGGVTYSGEALSPTGSAGKSYVRITPKVGAFGSAWLAYSGDATLKAAAAAGPLLATDVYGKGGLRAIDAFGINWYTVRLLPIREDPTWDKE